MLSLAVWLVLVQLGVLRNWKETEAYKNDVYLLPQCSIDTGEIAPPCTRCSAHRLWLYFFSCFKLECATTSPVRDDSAWSHLMSSQLG